MVRQGSGCAGAVDEEAGAVDELVAGVVWVVLGLAAVVLVCCRCTAVPLIDAAGKAGCDDELAAVCSIGLMMTAGPVMTAAIVVGGLLGAAR